MKDNGTNRSPKFYVAQGITLRMHEAILHVNDAPEEKFSSEAHRQRAINSLMERTAETLETMSHVGVITVEECWLLRHEFYHKVIHDIMGSRVEISRKEDAA